MDLIAYWGAVGGIPPPTYKSWLLLDFWSCHLCPAGLQEQSAAPEIHKPPAWSLPATKSLPDPHSATRTFINNNKTLQAFFPLVDSQSISTPAGSGLCTLKQWKTGRILPLTRTNRLVKHVTQDPTTVQGVWKSFFLKYFCTCC